MLRDEEQYEKEVDNKIAQAMGIAILIGFFLLLCLSIVYGMYMVY